MGAFPSSPSAPTALQACLDAVCAGRTACVAYPTNGLSAAVAYQRDWVKPFNLDVAVTPAAVVRPTSAADVAAIVRCAAAAGHAVQARSGGHSYANYGMGGGGGPGGPDTVALDLAALDQFQMDTVTWQATIGPGVRLGVMTQQLAAHGGRAVAHGVCPGVGLGGHATVGGLGPMSRMWGTCLDHVVGVEAVTANGTIVRASSDEHADLFFGLRGAASSFAVVTAFTLRTHPAPPAVVVQSAFAFAPARSTDDAAAAFSAWQALVADPTLDRRFATEFVLTPLGTAVTATFYGSAADWHASGIPQRLPLKGSSSLVVTDWLGALAQNAVDAALRLSDTPSSFYAKSLALARPNLLSADAVRTLFRQAYDGTAGTPLWSIIFDASGGAVADVPTNATAYAHRDALFFYQSYAVDPLARAVSPATRAFLDRFHTTLLGLLRPDNQPAAAAVLDNALGTYPGYVDPEITAPQQEYYMANLPALERLKAVWDPNQVFRNPQSVRPAAV